MSAIKTFYFRGKSDSSKIHPTPHNRPGGGTLKFLILISGANRKTNVDQNLRIFNGESESAIKIDSPRSHCKVPSPKC